MFGAWGTNNANNATNNPAQGTTGGFGATNAFGQPAQNTGGFGAFGQPQANAAQPTTGFGTTPGNNAFGAFGGGSTAFGAKPAGAFGATGAFGAAAQPAAGTSGFGGGAFGSATGATGAFGQPAAANNTTGTSAFGGGAFGSTGATNNAWAKPTIGGFGAPAQAGPATPQGTANPPYAETTERDSSATNVMLHYHSISCMPAYINYSPEELRSQDYAVGRKNASSNVPAGPAATGFGATGTSGFGQTPTTTGAFGQTAAPAAGAFGAFGAAANTTNPGGGLFGNNPATPGGFGSTNPTTNAFGQPAAPANPFSANTGATTGGFGGGAFGATTNTAGAFGSAANNNAAKPFGFGAASPATATNTGGFGAFGQPAAGATNNAAGGTNAFGQPATNNAFGAFGQNNANKPAGFGATGAFGATATGNNAFGQPGATTNAFGQQTQPANTGFGATPGNNAAGGAFGSFGQPAGQAANPFGQPAQPAQNPNPFGSFGQPAQPAAGNAGGFGGGLFGAKPATPTATTGGFGAFGQQPAGQQQNNALGASTLGGGLFGQNNNNNAGGGLFGQPKPGGILGNNNAANPFGGGFGQSTMGGFGASVNTNAAPAANTNPFGAFAGFGQQPANANNASTSTNLFTSSALMPQQQQQQPSLTASVDQPFNSGVPVFELLPGAAAAAGFAASAFGKKKQSNFFMKRKPMPSAKSVASLNASTINPLRGFANSTTTPFGGSVTSTRPGQSGISLMLKGGTTPSATNSASFGSSFMAGSLSDKKGLNSEVFSNTTPRTSVKKLVLDKDFSADDLSSALSRGNARKNTGNALELIRQSSASAPPPASRALVHKPADSARSAAETDKLEKGDYWIAPSEAVLGATPFKDLEAVLGFKCGRVGFGQVEFLDPVNLTTVGAVKEIPGKFILFDERECTVYPDEHEKPPVGQGLNVRARITLENCWATDRATREPIKTEDHPKHAAHVRKLKNMPNTTFDGFDIEKGQWSFIVEHFSRYGLGAEDDEEEDEMVAEAEAAAAAAVAPVLPSPMDRSMERVSSDDDESMDDVNARRASVRPRDVSMRPSKEPTPSYRRRGSVNRRRDDMVVDENDADNDEDDTAAEEAPDHTPASWPAQLGMDSQRVGQMQQNLFGAQNAAAAASARSKSVGIGKGLIKPPVRSGTPSALGKHPREMALMDEDAVEGDFKGRATSVERPSFAVSRAGPEVQDLQIVPARKFVKIAKDSMAYGKENLYRDAGLAFGRSFRVGWGPGGTLVHLGQICGPQDEVPPLDSFSVVTITKIDTTTLDEEEELAKSTELLRTYMVETEVNKDPAGNGVPQITRKSSLNFQPFAALFPQEDTSFEASLWRLASALFDEIPLDIPSDIDPTKKEWISALRRKMKVGDWLQTAVAPAVEQVMLDSAASPISRVFALLTGNQIERACHEAMDAGDFHLATLLSQIGGDKKFRDTMWSQWAIWMKSGTDVFIDEEYRKIYCLLAGEATYATSSKSDDPFLQVDRVRLTEGLDWKQAFALHYWYSCPMEIPVATAVEMYDEAPALESAAKDSADDEEEIEKAAVNPPPWYAEIKEDTDVASLGNHGDPMLHLLRLFQDKDYSLADTLAPRCFTPHKLDYRLSWTLFWVLCHSLKLDETSEEVANLGDQLTVGYAMQLESQSAPDAATFVLLHLRDPVCRAEAIKAMLMRSPPEIESGPENNFDSFKVPKRWIRASQGACARYLGHPHEAYKLYIQAHEQKFACDIVISDLIPDAIFRFDAKALQDLFNEFNPEKIDDWPVRGKLFLDYVDVIGTVPTLVGDIAYQDGLQPTPTQSARIDRIFSTVSTLLRLLPGILCPPQETRNDGVAASLPQDKRRKAALDEMKSTLVQLAENLQSILVRKQKLDLRGVEPGARLLAVQNAAYNQFYASISD